MISNNVVYAASKGSDQPAHTRLIVSLAIKLVTEKIKFSYFSAKTYVVGTQKKRLNETVLLSTKKIC